MYVDESGWDDEFWGAIDEFRGLARGTIPGHFKKVVGRYKANCSSPEMLVLAAMYHNKQYAERVHQCPTNMSEQSEELMLGLVGGAIEALGAECKASLRDAHPSEVLELLEDLFLTYK